MRRLHDWELIALHFAACLLVYVAASSGTVDTWVAIALTIMSGVTTVRVSRDGSREYHKWRYKRRKARQRKQARMDFLGD